MNYYNEFDPKTAAWLRELIKAKLIPAGEVDERSIELVQPSDLAGFTQCHFFAGIGGWSEALRLAGWPVDRPVWTGSCPCQPLSCAGLGRGEKDERHLWPEFHRLISQCRPVEIFGEQVASPLGVEWLDGISLDLEELGYAVASVDCPAAGVGSPHIRQRLFWLAKSGQQSSGRMLHRSGESPESDSGRTPNKLGRSSDSRVALGDTFGAGLEGQFGNVNNRSQPGRDASQPDRPTSETSGDVRMVNTNGERSQSRESSTAPAGHGNSIESGGNERLSNTDGEQINPSHSKGFQPKPSGGNAWGDYELLHFIDGKTRRIKSGVKPLAHGVSARVVKLRGIGNAIVPQVATVFIKAFLDIENEF